MTFLSPKTVAIGALLSAIAFLPSCSKPEESTAANAAGSKASDPAPSAVMASVDGASCAAHGALVDHCFICDPSLREKGRLWCREHTRYEDRCWLCHPELEDKERLYCQEHWLYEDECFLCHPELLETQPPKAAAPEQDANQGAGTSQPTPHAAALFCNEHGVMESDCGICHPELLSDKPPGQGLKIRLPSAESAERAGVVVGSPTIDSIADGITCPAELTFDLNNLAHMTPLVDGIIKSVEVDLGDQVQEGDVLARITSAAIGEAQGAYLKALAHLSVHEKALSRERDLHAERVSSDKDLQEAEGAQAEAMAAVYQARQQLAVFGFDEAQIEALTKDKATPGVLEIRAPFAGEIVERTAVRGAMAEMGTPLFMLADTTKLWAMVDIPESQVRSARKGQSVTLAIQSIPGETFTGTLTWISPQVNERTRMASARVEVGNPHGLLKARMFASALIETNHSERATIVPQGAVQDLSGTPVVFLRNSPDLFEARPVRLGARRDGLVEIKSGLLPSDALVVNGSFALKSQFLISRLGAGCVH